jgi:hypothetical protein
MKPLLPFLLLISCAATWAQPPSEKFPVTVTRFVAAETPALEQAVQARDRAYFTGALERAQTLIANVRNPAEMDRYPECSTVVLDFLIAGLCKISPPGTLCEPATFYPKVDANLAACKAQAGPDALSALPTR